MGIFEAVKMDTAVEEVIIRDPREHLILEASRPQGIPSMVEDGAVKVIEGHTSFEELERVVELPLPESETSAPATTTPPGTNPSPPDADTDAFLAHVVT
jgi:hypothetical protein